MWWSKRGRRTVRRTAVARVGVEALEGRALMTIAPVAISPGSAAGPVATLTTLTPTLTWSALTTVDGYQVRVLDRTTGTYAVAANVGGTATSYAIPAGTLTAGHRYTWSVWEVIKKSTVAPSEHLNFAAPSIPPKPTAVSPGSATGPVATLTTLTPTLTWSAVSNVNGYQVRVLDRTSGTYPVAATVGATATSYAVPSGKLTAGHYYQWSVWEVIGSRTVAPSEPLNFATRVPGTPVASPSVGTGNAARPVVSTFRPTLTWSAQSNVTGYELHVIDAGSNAVITHTLSASATSYTFAAGELTPGHQYNWNVRDVVNSVASRAVSNTERFQVPTLPVLTTIGPGTTGGAREVLTTSTPTFTWVAETAVGGFSGYQLTLVDRTNGKSTPVTLSASATSYTLPAGQLVAGHRYVWNLRIVDGTLTGKVASNAFRFFVAPAVGA